MKTHPKDFLFSMMTGTLLVLVSGWISFFLAGPWLQEQIGAYGAILAALLFCAGFGLLAALVVRLTVALFPLPAGEFDWTSPTATRWKFLTMVHFFGHWSLFLMHIAPALPLLYRLFGARIGKNVAIGGVIDSPFLVEIGDHSVIGHQTMVTANILMAQHLVLGPVKIGSHVTVGVFSMVSPGSQIGDNVLIIPSSIVMPGTAIPSGETWRGNPARQWQ